MKNVEKQKPKKSQTFHKGLQRYQRGRQSTLLLYCTTRLRVYMVQPTLDGNTERAKFMVCTLIEHVFTVAANCLEGLWSIHPSPRLLPPLHPFSFLYRAALFRPLLCAVPCLGLRAGDSVLGLLSFHPWLHFGRDFES